MPRIVTNKDIDTPEQLPNLTEPTGTCENGPMAEPSEPNRNPETESSPRIRSRSCEQLAEVTARSMTTTEKHKYIDHLRRENAALQLQVQQLEDNCKSAYNKVAVVTEEANQRIANSENRIKLMKQNVQLCAKTVIDLI